MGKVYTGNRTGDRVIVMVRLDNGKGHHLTIHQSQAIHNHSSEFSWGYGGSGPAQLALAILLDHIGSTELDQRVYRETAASTAQRFYQQFKFDFIQDLPDRWEIKSVDIEGWIRMKYNNAEAKKRDYSHEPQFPKELGGTGPGGTILNG